jgi:hypothetical protein
MILARWQYVALLALIASVGVVAAASSAASAAERASCPVTLPKSDKPGADPFGPGGFNYGNGRIRAQIWPNGDLIAGRLPNGGSWATINPDGSIVAKLGWWRGVPGNLTITGHRIDAHAAALRADIPPTKSYSKTGLGFIPTGLTFPTLGCWRVVGTQGGASLTFVVRVTKTKQK